MYEQSLPMGHAAQQVMPTARTKPAGFASWSDSLFDRLLADRIIMLTEEINDESANKVCVQMLLLAAEDPDADITLYINSPGGSITAGMAIFDTMNYVSCDVATYAMGMAASMGQFLLTAGAPGKRHALPNAEIMMHQPSSGIGGTESDITIQAERLQRTKARMNELNATHSGQPVERIREDSERDRWFIAEEAIEYGLVDKLVRGQRGGNNGDGNGSA